MAVLDNVGLSNYVMVMRIYFSAPKPDGATASKR